MPDGDWLAFEQDKHQQVRARTTEKARDSHDERTPWTHDFKVADLSLAEFGRKEIRLAEHEMPGLMAMRGSTAPASRSRAPGSPARCT